MLDQVVVWVTGEGQGVEAEGVYDGKFQDIQVGVEGLEVGYVEGDDVVAQEEQGVLRQPVEALQATAVGLPGHGQRVVDVGPVGGRSQKDVVFERDLQIQGDTTAQGRIGESGASGRVRLSGRLEQGVRTSDSSRCTLEFPEL